MEWVGTVGVAQWPSCMPSPHLISSPSHPPSPSLTGVSQQLSLSPHLTTPHLPHAASFPNPLPCSPLPALPQPPSHLPLPHPHHTCTPTHPSLGGWVVGWVDGRGWVGQTWAGNLWVGMGALPQPWPMPCPAIPPPPPPPFPLPTPTLPLPHLPLPPLPTPLPLLLLLPLSLPPACHLLLLYAPSPQTLISSPDPLSSLLLYIPNPMIPIHRSFSFSFDFSFHLTMRVEWGRDVSGTGSFSGQWTWIWIPDRWMVGNSDMPSCPDNIYGSIVHRLPTLIRHTDHNLLPHLLDGRMAGWDQYQNKTRQNNNKVNKA